MPWLLLSLHLVTGSVTIPAKECADFVAKLETCTPYKCIFVHPFTGERMEKRIVEYRDGKCSYTEQMPNGGKMECAYADSMRKAVAKYQKDLEAATAAGKSVGTSVSVKATTGGKAKTQYTIDGKEVENPLQEALKNGQCKISGYEKLPKRNTPKKE
jgi:DNA-binding protein YbaB